MDKQFKQAQGIQRRSAILETTPGAEYVIRGYAATFNSWSKPLGGFIERIKPGAFTRSINGGADVKCLFNHSADTILGRTKSGTLTLEQDSRGLKFVCQLNKDSQQHRDIWAAVSRHDVTECSFAFTVAPGGQSWADGNDPDTGEPCQLRTLTDVDLQDVSVVTYPAYNETNVDARAATVNKSHGMLEAVAFLRSATQRLVKAMRSDSSSPNLDFAGHLSAAHEQAEMCCTSAARCDELIGDDDDADDEVFRGHYRMAQAHCRFAAESFAAARVRYADNKSKKAAKALGRNR